MDSIKFDVKDFARWGTSVIFVRRDCNNKLVAERFSIIKITEDVLECVNHLNRNVEFTPQKFIGNVDYVGGGRHLIEAKNFVIIEY